MARGALFLLFVLLYSQRVASQSCETLRELLHHPGLPCRHVFKKCVRLFGTRTESCSRFSCVSCTLFGLDKNQRCFLLNKSKEEMWSFTLKHALGTADYELDVNHGLRYKTLSKHYGLGIKRGLRYKMRTFGLNTAYRLHSTNEREQTLSYASAMRSFNLLYFRPCWKDTNFTFT